MMLGWLPSKRRRLWVRRAVLLASLVLTWRYVLQPTVVSGFSMEPTLYNGDRVLVFKLINGPYPVHLLQRLDIVQCLRPGPGRELIVKRVIGLPGDKVRIVEGDVFVNGTLLRDSRSFGLIPQESVLGITRGRPSERHGVCKARLRHVPVVAEDEVAALGEPPADRRRRFGRTSLAAVFPDETRNFLLKTALVIAVTWSLDPLAYQRGPEITSGGCAFRAFRTNRLLIRPL